jgi:hypothetical protein
VWSEDGFVLPLQNPYKLLRKKALSELAVLREIIEDGALLNPIVSIILTLLLWEVPHLQLRYGHSIQDH